MNPVLLIGGGGLAAYLLLRHRDAKASTHPVPAAGPLPTPYPILVPLHGGDLAASVASPGAKSPPLIALPPVASPLSQPLSPVGRGPQSRPELGLSLLAPQPASAIPLPLSLPAAGRWPQSRPEPSLPIPGPKSPPFVALPPPQSSPMPQQLPPVGASPQITKPAPPFVGEVARPALHLEGRWGWPVPRWQGRAPVCSSKYGTARPGMKHMGVDVMFGRVSADPFPVGSPNGSRAYVMPDFWPAVAASDGVLWSATRTPRGYAVVIDHGNVATFYQHLETLFVPETKPKRGSPRSERIPVKAGQPLGVIGADPLDGEHLKHLHFELWPNGPQSAIDPARLMAGWEVFGAADVGKFMTARNAKADRTKERLTPKQDPNTGLIRVQAHTRRLPVTSLAWS